MKDEFCKSQNCGHYIPKEIAGIGGTPMASGRCRITLTGVKKIKKCPRLTYIPEDKE